jgi:hypothetical protein
LTTESFDKWRDRWNTKQKAFFPDYNDWVRLYELAQEFKAEFGLPVVVNVGDNAIFFDTGMSVDLQKLYELSVSSTEASMREIIRGLFLCPTNADIVRSTFAKEVKLPAPRHFLITNSIFKNGGSLGKGSIIVNSIFEEEVHIPENTIIVDSHIIALDAESEPGTIVYSYNAHQNNSPLRLLRDCVHFSAFVKPSPTSRAIESETYSGVFPIKVNAKDKPTASTPAYLSHYNVNENVNKTYLEQSILGFPEPVSFKQLMSSRRVSLDRTLTHLAKLRAPKHSHSAL